MSSSESNPDNFDQYGFQHRYSFNRAREYYKVEPSSKTNNYIIAKTLAIGFLLFIIASGIISGVHAWRQFPMDSIWIKLVRVWVAVIFAPFYIFYIFIKTTVFKDV
tara:strand:- start:440 stop:757 length:318 start_codon:yes stop_codon:yes gene_type:complete